MLILKSASVGDDMKQVTGWWHRLTSISQDRWLTGLVLLVALAPRLVGLRAFLTADEPKSWFGRSIQFLNALLSADFAATFDSPAPGVTTMWAGTIGLILDFARQGFPGSLGTYLAQVPFDPLDPAILPLIRLPVVLVAALAAVLTFWWARPLFGRTAALLAALLLALDPFLLALTRILGHDGLVTLFMWLSLLAFLRATVPQPEIKPGYLLLSGLLGGLAFLTKYPALFLGAFIALTLLVFHWQRRRNHGQMFRAWVGHVALWSVAAGLVFVLLWPAMWVDPVGRVVAIFSDALRATGSPHQKGGFFMGQPVADPGPSFYLIVTLFKTTPVLWVGLALGVIQLMIGGLRRQSREPWFQSGLVLLAYALLFGLLVTYGGKKQDRYILPAFPALITLAAVGYSRLPELLDPAGRRRWIQATLVPGIVALQLLFVLPYHPYYFTYYSPLMGGGQTAVKTIIVGWGEGLDQAAAWLNQQPDAQQLQVVAWYSTTFEPFFEGQAIYKIEEEKISRTPKPGLAADYVVFYVNQIQRQIPSAGALQFFRAEPPVHTITLNGTDYAWIYPSLQMQHVIAAESRLVGQAELQGFNLWDDARRPVTSLAPDRTTTVELYWEWQGKVPDEPIGLALVDGQGNIWGEGIPLGSDSRFPFEAWQPGMIAWDTFALTPWPGTPPGEYSLKAWIDRPTTGERVGDFPVNADMQVTVDRPAGPLPVEVLDLTHPINVPVADGALTLVGVRLAAGEPLIWPAGEAQPLQLFWQANRAWHGPLAVTLRLVAENGTERMAWPVELAGITDLQSGDLVRVPLELPVPAHVPPGQYQLTLHPHGEAGVEFPLLPVTITGRPRLFDAPESNLAVNATFGDTIILLGLAGSTATPAELRVEPGQSVSLNPVWQALGLIETDYTITAQLLDGEQVVAQHDSMPLGGAAPTSSWAVGEIVADDLPLTIPADTSPGQYQLLLAIYQVETGQRLLLSSGQDHLKIPVVVGP
jgi:hypothetical protein